MPTLKEIIKDLKENLETYQDIVMTYQNDIYRQSSDDYDDLKRFWGYLKINVKDLEETEEMLSKDKEQIRKFKSFTNKNGESIVIPDKSQWKNKTYNRNNGSKNYKNPKYNKES